MYSIEENRRLWPDQGLVTHTANETGRDFVAGDVHGHFDTLEHALATLKFDAARDRLFSAGDLIDHGPRSADALDWLTRGRILAVRGNHEQMLVDCLTLERGILRKSGVGWTWLECGGRWWWALDENDDDAAPLQLEADHEARRARWLGAMRAVPYLRRIDTAAGPVGFAHTMPIYNGDWGEVERIITDGARHAREPWPLYSDQTPTAMLWNRPDIERERRDAPDLPRAMTRVSLVLTGHTPGLHPRWTRKNVLCIDTGVHVPEYGHLTIAEVQSGGPTLHRFATQERSP